MRSPARTLAGHLTWTRTGSVWALWRLQPLPYGYRRAKDKREARALHQALIRALPGESLLLGVCAGMADQFGFDILWTRVAFVALTLLGFGLPLLLYLTVAILAP